MTVPVYACLFTRCLYLRRCLCLFGSFGRLPVLDCPSVHRRQNHRTGEDLTAKSMACVWGGGGPFSALNLAPNPVEARDSLGCLAKEERKGPGPGRGMEPHFPFHGLLLPGDSFCLILVQRPEAEQQVRRHSGTHPLNPLSPERQVAWGSAMTLSCLTVTRSLGFPSAPRCSLGVLSTKAGGD